MYLKKSKLIQILIGISIATTGLFFLKKDIPSIQAQIQSPTPTPSKPKPQEIVVNNEVRSLPGSLDNVPLFNSDSPEWVKKDRAYSYTIATLRGGKLVTEQVQTAKLLVRYPDTAYEAHGNYGVHYDLTLPLYNTGEQAKSIAITLETPLKDDKLNQGGLRFRQPPLDFPYFRGTVRLRYKNDRGQNLTRYVHLWHRVGQILEPMVKLNLAAGEKRLVRVDFIKNNRKAKNSESLDLRWKRHGRF
jgi:Protein of unknown function (DUF3370)